MLGRAMLFETTIHYDELASLLYFHKFIVSDLSCNARSVFLCQQHKQLANNNSIFLFFFPCSILCANNTVQPHEKTLALYLRFRFSCFYCCLGNLHASLYTHLRVFELDTQKLEGSRPDCQQICVATFAKFCWICCLLLLDLSKSICYGCAL
jgi:hypothetical protein